VGLPNPKHVRSLPTPVKLRPAAPSDAEGWITLLEEVAAEGHFIALESVGMTRRQLARHLRLSSWSDEGAALVAVSEGVRVVGQLTLVRDRGIYRHTAELGMSITSAYRGMGLGTAMIEGAFDWARTHRVEKLCLNVFPHNERAIALYEKMGFAREGHRSRHAKLSYGYEDLIEMAVWV